MGKPPPSCKCGSRRFKAAFTLELFDVPVLLRLDSSLRYDDTKGRTDGWDILRQPEVSCARCGHLYHLVRLPSDTSEDRPRYILKDMQPKEKGRSRRGPHEP